MLDSFAVGNLIGENLSLKDRILVDHDTFRTGPSDSNFGSDERKTAWSTLLIKLSNIPRTYSFPVEPYCVKTYFEEPLGNMLGHNLSRDSIRLYSLDRIESVEMTDRTFKMDKDFCAADYFSSYFGIVTDERVKPTRIVLRANANHTPYLKSLPLHHSQRLIEDNGEYADFELFLAPTYDFIMKLLQVGGMIEVIQPASLRHEMKGWITDMNELYKND